MFDSCEPVQATRQRTVEPTFGQLEVNDMEKTMERNGFVVVLKDGDCMNVRFAFAFDFGSNVPGCRLGVVGYVVSENTGCAFCSKAQLRAS